MKTKSIDLKNITKFLFYALLTVFFFAGVAQAMVSKTANDTVVSEKVQEYKVLRNVPGEEYVLLENTDTGEYYETSSDYEGCDFWTDKRDGTVLKLNEISKTAKWGSYKELNGINVDICVPFYQARNQL